MAIEVNQDKCTGCGACVSLCPAEAIEMQGEKAVVVTDNCTQCGVCIDSCPEQAIEQE